MMINEENSGRKCDNIGKLDIDHFDPSFVNIILLFKRLVNYSLFNKQVIYVLFVKAT